MSAHLPLLIAALMPASLGSAASRLRRRLSVAPGGRGRATRCRRASTRPRISPPTSQQELVIASAGKTMHAKGTVAFKRPGKMRWTLTDGVAQVIVADGTTLWFYQPDEQQVLKAPVPARLPLDARRSRFSPASAASTTTSTSRSTDERTAVRRGCACSRAGEAELGALQPHGRPRQSYDIVGAEMHRSARATSPGCSSRDLHRNVGLDDDAFHFEVPPGVDVVEAPIGTC